MEQVGGTHYYSSYQHWDWAIDMGLGPLEYGVTRYICRHWKKGGIEDLKKAKHFLWKIESKGAAYRNKYIKCRPKFRDDYHTERFCEINEIPEKEKLLLDILANWTNRHNLDYANIILDELIVTSELAAGSQDTVPGGRVTGAGIIPSLAPAVAGAGGNDTGGKPHRLYCSVCGQEDSPNHICGEENQ